MEGQYLSSERRGRFAAAVPWLALTLLFVAFYTVFFAPILIQHRFLAPTDGAIYYLPFFDLPIGQTWNSHLLSGYSIIADIQSQVLYPLRWISPSYNALVILGYVVAALGTFGLALRLTGSRLGALLAAFVVSGSGFMIGHLSHLAIVHAATWIPAMLWAVAALRDSRSRWPVVLGALAVAMCVYGGHPQISIMGLLLAGCYGVHEIVAVARQRGRDAGLRMFARVCGVFALGLALAMPVLLPLAQASRDGVRSAWTIADFDSFSHTWSSLRLLWFPNLYGAYSKAIYGGYTGPWNLGELAIYAGIAPWMLMFAALAGARPARAFGFWLGALAVGLLLCLGASTAVGEAVYHLPVIGKFRAQGRFAIVVIIALAVLSAYGVSALMRAPLSKRRSAALLAGCVAVIAVAVLPVALDPPAPFQDGGFWRSARGWLPLLFLGGSAAAIALLAWRRSHAMALTLIALSVVDLGSFGWLGDWRYFPSASIDEARPPETATALADLRRGPGRLLPLDADNMDIAQPLRPNVNMRYGIDSVVGYGPLLPARYAAYTSANTLGALPLDDPNAPLMDVLGVRWIAGKLPRNYPQSLGSGCGTIVQPMRVRAALPAGVALQALRVTSHMNCSVLIGQGQTMARLTLLDASGRALGPALTLDAGEEISEEAYDREDVRAQIKHQRAPVVQEKPAPLRFLGELPLTGADAAGAATTVQVEVGDTGGALVTLDKIEAIERDSGRALALPIMPPEVDREALAPERVVPGLPAFAERRRFRGLAWGVCRAEAAGAQDIVLALTAGVYRGDAQGRFDPFALALLDAGRDVPSLNCRKPPRISELTREHGRWRMRVNGDGDGLAVVSESFDRDWIARVDGARTKVFPVDGAIMGVVVPAGEHIVELSYRSRGYRLGLALALCAAAVCFLLLVPLRRRGRSGEALPK